MSFNNIQSFYRYLKNNNLFFTHNKYPREFYMFINFLIKENALNIYFENFLKNNNTKFILIKLHRFQNLFSRNNYIVDAFPFHNTIQGVSYWNSLHLKWLKFKTPWEITCSCNYIENDNDDLNDFWNLL